jgi:quercetin dioxygenase-like cupin family protein
MNTTSNTNILETNTHPSITDLSREPLSDISLDAIPPNPSSVPKHVVGKSTANTRPDSASQTISVTLKASVAHLGEVAEDDQEKGLLRKCMAETERLTVYHCNIFAYTQIPLHHHSEEQFGFICRGAIALDLNDERFILYEGDSYYIPSGVPHSYTALYDSKILKIMITPG